MKNMARNKVLMAVVTGIALLGLTVVTATAAIVTPITAESTTYIGSGGRDINSTIRCAVESGAWLVVLASSVLFSTPFVLFGFFVVIKTDSNQRLLRTHDRAPCQRLSVILLS